MRKPLIRIFIAMIWMVLVFILMQATAFAADEVSYLSKSWDESENKVA